MKKFVTMIVVAVFLAISFCAVPVYAENILDKAGDWWATRGKQEPEKSMILTQRKAERAAKEAQKQAEKSGKEMKKSMDNMFKK